MHNVLVSSPGLLIRAELHPQLPKKQLGTQHKATMTTARQKCLYIATEMHSGTRYDNTTMLLHTTSLGKKIQMPLLNA